MLVTVSTGRDEDELDVADVEVAVDVLDGVVEVLLGVVEVEVDVDVLVLVDVGEVLVGSSDSVSDVAGAADVVGTADDVVGAAGLWVVPASRQFRLRPKALLECGRTGSRTWAGRGGGSRRSRGRDHDRGLNLRVGSGSRVYRSHSCCICFCFVKGKNRVGSQGT